MTAWFALVRVAWRNARRARMRSLLVMALIAVPVAAVVGVATGARMAIASDADEIAGRFGSADLTIHPTTDPNTLRRSSLEEALPVDGRIVAVEHLPVQTRERFDSVVLTAAPIEDPIFDGKFSLLEGRTPEAPDEIAPDLWVMDRYDLEIGDSLAFDEIAEPFTVVGVAVSDESTDDQAAFVAPGSITGRPAFFVDTGTIGTQAFIDRLPTLGFVDTQGRGSGPAQVDSEEGRDTIEIARRDAPPTASAKRDAAAAGVFAAGVIAVGLAGLVASAAFAVSVRRRQRELGLLGAIGAEPPHLRRLVILEGFVVGLAGSALGTGLGLFGVVLARPRLQEQAGRLIGGLQITPGIVLGGLALGSLGAVFSAWLPARAVTHGSTSDLLRARRPPPKRSGRLAVAGLATAVLGLALVLAGSGAANQPLLVVGGLATFLGVLLAAPIIIERLATLAQRLPVLARIGVRDIARNRTRSAAMFAALFAVLTVPVAAQAAADSERSHSIDAYVPSMDPTHVLLASPDPGAAPSPAQSIDDVAGQFLAVLDNVEAAAPMRRVTVSDHDRPIEAQGGTWAERRRFVGSDTADDPYWGELVVADTQLLDAFDIADEQPALEDGVILGVGPGTATSSTVQLRSGADTISEASAAKPTDALFGFELPTHLVSEDWARSRGYEVGRAQAWIFRLEQPPDDATIDELRSISNRAGFMVSKEVGRLQPPVIPIGLMLTFTGGIALSVIVIVAALAAAETRQDRRLLAAVGGTPSSGRTAAAAGMGVLTAIAGATASLLGSALVGAHQLGRPPEWPGGPAYGAALPWTSILAAIIAVPVAAAIATWALNGTNSRRIARPEL